MFFQKYNCVEFNTSGPPRKTPPLTSNCDVLPSFLNGINPGNLFVEKKLTFEIGGKNKNNQQIAGVKNGFIAADDIETGFGN